MTATYEPTPLSVDARILIELDKRLGRPTKAEDVVAEAEDPEHPWHSKFEWDNDIAGHRHRLDVAHRIIIQARIVLRNPSTGHRISARVMLHDPGSRGYQPANYVINTVDVRNRVVDRLMTRLYNLTVQMRQFQEFAEVVEFLDHWWPDDE